MPLSALLVLVVIAAFLASALLTPLAGRVACALQIVDHPGGRKAHARPTPLLGGAVIFGIIFFAFGGAALVFRWDHASVVLGGVISGYADLRIHALPHTQTLLGLIAGMAVMFVTGLIDDLHKDRFPPAAKLLGQTVAATIAVVSGARTDVLVLIPLNVLGSILWIVAIANAINFLDHADGLASGVSLVAVVIFFAVAILLEQFLIALALAALSGALLGFLIHNFPPARIFLGDSGALTIGYLLGALTLLESYVTRRSTGSLPVLLPPIVLALPIFDMAVVLIARIRSRRPLHVADRNHLHHRLTRLGMSPRAALFTAWLATLSLGAGAASLPEATAVGACAILVQVLATMGLLSTLMFFGAREEGP